eukprot:CAMPEP_0197033530 /NCGR_PEP_ID=MMETSP1384-20130603/11911_1 /TAXON_ID=29189 /ORGANISM="Ammonia sp." /LENGTH=1137 /DNA_ID=CAMNT_0042463347 /DNA_START=267 /DNA_END=3680 /DNA_ORIENTATION=+
MSTDTEYQSLLAPALSMSEREAAAHYYNLAENWYHLQNNKAFKAFSKHIPRITKLLQSTDVNTRLEAVRALAFIAACPRLHKQLFEEDILKYIVYILGSSPEAANCEAALVVLNHLCQQSPTQKRKFAFVSDFCKDKQSLIIIFRYAHVEDRCLSIIANVMSVLAALCTERPNIQENCIRAGIMERAFNLKTSHRDRIVRANVDLFLQSMQLQDFSVDKFNEMHTLICIQMGYSSRALCLAIWRLVVTDRFHDASRTNTLFSVVDKIAEEDPTLDDDWNVVVVPQKSDQNDSNGHHIEPNQQHSKPNQPQSPQPVKHIERPHSARSHSPPFQPSPPEDESDDKENAEEPPPMRRIQSLKPKYSDNSNGNLGSSSDLPPFPPLRPSPSWLVQEMHIAILQTNPIDTDDGGNLALNAERKRLNDIFYNTKRGLKIFFGVLTKDALIRCILRGAQIVHISGHGPYASTLKVEDKFGRTEDLSADKIKNAIERGGNKQKGGGLKLVFVSTCYSEQVAKSFCDAGVPHVVAVHSMVQILDQMATKFASAFYEALIAHRKTVDEAFNNSKAELLLEKETDCCCRHEGHIGDCRCPICKIYRCCVLHHGPTSRCTQKKSIPCCQPKVPHAHSDKFLLLPEKANHGKQILTNLPIQNQHVQCERIDSRPPTNIGQPNQKIIGRTKDTRILVDFLHPDMPSDHQGDVLFVYGRPKIGITTLALQVGRFFTRPWYQAIFPGGVFRVNLDNCDDPNYLYSYLAQAMNVRDGTFGTYSYWDQQNKQYSPYPQDTQKDLHKQLSGDDIRDPIMFHGFIDEDCNVCYPEHYIIMDQHKNHKDTVQGAVPEIIYKEFEKRIRMLPMEFYVDPKDDNKVLVRRIKFTPPEEDRILVDIRKYGTNSDEYSNFEFQKMFIIDHISFPDAKLKQFMQKIKRLVENVKCKLLLCCHDTIERKIHRIQQQNVANCMPKHRTWRIQPIQKKDAAKLLLEQARQLYEFDFTDISTPSTAEETSQFALFEWLSKSPALVQQCCTVLDRKVPFCVIIKMMSEEPSKWNLALKDWQQPLKLTPDTLKDALNALTTLLTEINVVKSIWSDQPHLFQKPYMGQKNGSYNNGNYNNGNSVNANGNAPPQQNNQNGNNQEEKPNDPN